MHNGLPSSALPPHPFDAAAPAVPARTPQQGREWESQLITQAFASYLQMSPAQRVTEEAGLQRLQPTRFRTLHLAHLQIARLRCDDDARRPPATLGPGSASVQPAPESRHAQEALTALAANADHGAEVVHAAMAQAAHSAGLRRLLPTVLDRMTPAQRDRLDAMLDSGPALDATRAHRVLLQLSRLHAGDAAADHAAAGGRHLAQSGHRRERAAGLATLMTLAADPFHGHDTMLTLLAHVGHRPLPDSDMETIRQTAARWLHLRQHPTIARALNLTGPTHRGNAEAATAPAATAAAANADDLLSELDELLGLTAAPASLPPSPSSSSPSSGARSNAWLEQLLHDWRNDD